MTVRALVIAPQPFFSNRGTPLSVYYRNLVLSELGVHIDLVTYGEGQDVSISNMKIIRIPRFSWLGNVEIGPSWLKLFLDFFLALRVFLQLLVRRYDFLHAHEEAIFICRFLKPIFRFKLIYDMHSNLEQQLTNMRFTRSRLIKGAFRRMQESCIRVSDVVITICPALACYVRAVQDEPAKIFVIENSIFDAVRIAEPDAVKNEVESAPHSAASSVPADRRVILYAGTLESYQGIELLLAAFRDTISRCSDVFLLVVGGTRDQVKYFTAMADRLGISEQVLLLGNVPHEQAVRYQQSASILISPRIEGSNTPLKIYHQIASGIPLVATDIEAHRQVLDETVAFLAPPDPRTLAQAIVNALTCNEDAARRATEAQRLYSRKYSRASYTEKVSQALAVVL
jgi:glycosyltransferase involved in cell wall biosynthesis